MFDLTGKVALVTGSSRGIGKAIAEAMAAAGAKVVVSSRKPEPCAAVAQAICESGAEAIAIPCNVSKRDELEALVDKTLAHWDQINVLVCNANISPHHGSLHEISDEAYDAIMNTNVKNTLWLCNRVIPQMAEREDGVVIIISSIAALKGTRKLGAYAMSKAAHVQLARNLALEWGHANVRVNCIAPGLVRTHMARALWEDPESYTKALRSYPLGRIGEPEDIAGAAVFLAARAGAFITGQTIVIDGGATVAGGQYS
jgi:dehydrogenase/reductase SDR family protein 4